MEQTLQLKSGKKLLLALQKQSTNSDNISNQADSWLFFESTDMNNAKHFKSPFYQLNSNAAEDMKHKHLVFNTIFTTSFTHLQVHAT